MTADDRPVAARGRGRRRAAAPPAVRCVRWSCCWRSSRCAGGLAWALLRDGAAPRTGREAGREPAQPVITTISAALLPPIVQTRRPSGVRRQGVALVQVDRDHAKASGGEVTLQVRRDGDWADAGHRHRSTGRARVLRGARRPTDSTPHDAGRRRAPTGECGSATFTADGWKLGVRRPVHRRRPRPDQVELPAARHAQRLRAHQVGELPRGGRRRERRAASSSVAGEPGPPGLLPQRARRHREHLLLHLRRLAAARIKFQKPRGMHGSFWLQSPIFGSVPGDAKRPARDRHGGVLRVDVPGRRAGAPSPTTWARTASSVKTGGLQTEIERRDRQAGRRVVEEVPRVLRRVDPRGLRLPHRRRRDVPADQEHLRGAGVPGAQPAVLGLGAPGPRPARRCPRP